MCRPDQAGEQILMLASIGRHGSEFVIGNRCYWAWFSEQSGFATASLSEAGVCAVNEGGEMASAADRDPRHHTQKILKALADLQSHLRDDIRKVDEPPLKAMFETAAEVFGGLMKAFRDYEQKNEAAWR